jgi:hypothetical protein
VRFLPAALVAAALAGCAALQPVPPFFENHLVSESASVRECARWYRALDEAIDAAGVRDAQYPRLAGFPYLRIERPLAALRERAAASEPALRAFAERLLDLDLDARQHEIANLPGATFGLLAEVTQPSQARALQRTRECGRLLRDQDLSRPQARAAMLAAAQVPDDYSAASRALGLYPVTRLFFMDGVRRWEAEAQAGFARSPAASSDTVTVRFAPPRPASAPATRAVVAGLLGRAELDPLGHPALSERELARVAPLYAPSFEVAISGDYDRFGALRWWRPGAAVPEVDTTAPTVYVQQTVTRYQDRLLLQLVYTIWFPERPPGEAPDLLAGRLDGLVWRVTLAPDGEPLIYDSIHPCGCYHQFFPTPRARPRPAPGALEEWAFVPQALPRVEEQERPLVRLAPRTHYIEGVSLVRGADSVVRYAMQDYDVLRSLALPQGGRRSVFGPDGLIAGSERAERFLFWPMGIASAGAMRQWGRHATAFVGRRHFDDADLFEKRFELDLP